ncbi:hypothetical protein [Oscillatoria sp. FACHB-1406]|uniref:hypothetical protein n=1 Tax=Oscillatoria sp. FACHB-1406 TaxID=2692846 RepID=UPI001684C980|nr:hypothetical protein [Oscillatoria sp. FACHB-1406]MBD2578529.1 hypothetical protein [Oscillatoria sp. FACHB-1406]
MELDRFVIWAVAVSLVAGLGIGIMLWAYRGSGSTAVLFAEAVPLATALEADRTGNKAKESFEKGCEAFNRGNYQQARDRFTQAIGQLEDLPEAYHNRGLCWANLRQDDDAAVNLVRASELYAQSDNPDAIAQIKQQLEAIKARKLARERK